MRIDVRLSNYDPAGSRMVLPMVSERDTVLHSWCVPAQWQAPTIVGGRGAHFWDADGHDYLDMSSLSECSNLGHQHPAVVKAICEQAERS
jgi:taurine--2-oxoglutarate transaminase